MMQIDPNAYTAIRDAMQDLLTAPKGVVPDTAQPFYDGKAGVISSTLVYKFLMRGLQS